MGLIRRLSSSPRPAQPPLSLRCHWSTCRLHADFASAIRAALQPDPVLRPLAAAAQAQEPSAAAPRALLHQLVRRAAPSSTATGCSTAVGGVANWQSHLRAGGRTARAGAARAPVPLSGHFGRDKTLALSRRSLACTCAPTRLVNASRLTTCHQQAFCSPCLYPRDAEGVSAWPSSSCPLPAPATPFCRCTLTS